MKQPSPDRAVLSTPSDLVVVYAGRRALLPGESEVIVPLSHMGFAYSYDFTLNDYRWTLQRPLAERCPRFYEKILALAGEGGEERLFLGVVFNGFGNAKPAPEVRGLVFPRVRNVRHALSVAQTGLIVDVVTGLSAEPQPWASCPGSLSQDPEFR